MFIRDTFRGRLFRRHYSQSTGLCLAGPARWKHVWRVVIRQVEWIYVYGTATNYFLRPPLTLTNLAELVDAPSLGPQMQKRQQSSPSP
jgi:hypothetical protein